MKLTKQGVRDLNHLKAPQRPKAILPPKQDPIGYRCRHPYKTELGHSGAFFCRDCGETWDFDGRVF